MRVQWLGVIAACAALYAQKEEGRADIRVDVGLVPVTCAVTDRNGVPVKDLTAADFELHDNGRVQKIDQVWQESDLPLTVGLIVDVSGSQSAFIDKHRRTAGLFLTQVIRPQDRAFIVTVGPDVKLLADLTASPEELRKGLDRMEMFQHFGSQFGESCEALVPLRGCGGTALWNGVYAAAGQKMRWVHGRKALIILSDGLDTGSPHSLSDVVESVQESATVVYAIKYVDHDLTPGQAGVSSRRANLRGMERLTDETGGFTFPDPEDNLSQIFSKIEQDLRNQYVLGFSPPPEARDGRFHKLEVKMTRPEVTVRARAGYYAATR
jgi:Ca-activated chloride channel family protein